MTNSRTGNSAPRRTIPLKVLIVEDSLLDHQVQVRNLSKFRERIEIVGSCRTATDGLAAAQAQPMLDAVLLDLKIPYRPRAGERYPENGIWLLEELVALRKERGRRFGIVVISNYDLADAELVAWALRSGADGYLAKDDSLAAPDFIVRALELTRAGEVVLSSTAKRAKERAMGLLLLTDAEFDVWKLDKKGLSNNEIAVELCIQVKTVEKHQTEIFGKLGVASRTQAAVYPKR